MQALTMNERQVLAMIFNSEYQDGTARERVVNHEVWTSYCNPFPRTARRTFSGTVSSLVKKGLVKTGGSTNDANYDAGCDGTTLRLTDAGFDAATNVGAFGVQS